MPRDESDVIADALRAKQVGSYFSNLPWAIGGAVFTALLFAATQRDAIPAPWLLGWLAALAALVLLVLTARRARQVVRSYVALRVDETARAAALRASEELLERTGATAGVGGWELDLATMALRLTAQAYRLHDVEPVVRPTFEGFIALYAPPQQVWLREGFAAVAEHGTPFDRELPLTTPRGRKRWVRLIGQPQLEGGKVVRINGVVQDITQTKVAELALAEQHHLLELLVKTTHEGFWFVDAEAVTTDVNPAMCTILDRAREEIVGRSIFEFVDDANAAIFRTQVQRRGQGVAGGYEIALTRPDDGRVDCYNNATPIFDTVGQRIGSIGMWTDISERKRAEQRLRATSDALAQKTLALQVTLDSITQGIVSVDADGRTRVYNRRAIELLDLPESMLLAGATYDEVVRFQIARGELNGDASFGDAHGEHRYFEGGRANSPDVYVRRSCSGVLIEVRTRQLPDGGLVRTYADVTAYLDAQQALHDSEAELRALLGARKDAEQALIVAKDEAERANRAKSQFLSSMSHELRTPMNAILGFGQLLVSDPLHPLPERQRDHVREILRGARHLLALINEVLDLALVETGKLRISLEPVQLAPLIDECLGLLRPLARSDGIEVTLPDAAALDCLVVADRTRLKQVLLNLLSNAIKYNRPGGQVRIACTSSESSVRIGISDSGQGLSGEQRARLFQAFERLDAAQSQVEGAGLGLALSQRLMHAMHGEIGLDSEVGCGSTFWIRLPQAAPQKLAAAVDRVSSLTGELSSASGRARKVLYIEDNPVNVLLMEAMLARMANLDVLSAPLPALGLQMAADERPDLILLDIQLPDMDGYEVLRRLRLDEASRAIPVIAVSANAMASDVARGLGAGFVRYLTKPLDMQTLLAAVDAALPSQ